MPFGIRSAPEILQRRMHKLIEGMPRIEVVADDFVVVGYGETQEEATQDNDMNLMGFLQLCEDRGLKLNIEKLTLKRNCHLLDTWRLVMACERTQTRLRRSVTHLPLQTRQECRG